MLYYVAGLIPIEFMIIVLESIYFKAALIALFGGNRLDSQVVVQRTGGSEAFCRIGVEPNGKTECETIVCDAACLFLSHAL